jgi:3-isopropylmalate dehydrogenase
LAFNVVLLPGDGIGPEVIREARRALERVAELFRRDIVFTEHLIGGAALSGGRPPLPEETLKAAMASDGVLLGAVGDPRFDHLPPGSRPESGLLAIRKGLGVFANLRPAKAWTGLESSGPLKPEVLAGTDMIVVRELLGGLYYGTPREWNHATDQAINTLRYSRMEVERVAHVAFGLAMQRQKRLVSVDKANVLETSQLWRATVNDVAKRYPDVKVTHEYVDACAMKLACAPASFDVLLTENLFGDILSDEAGAICGSLGMLPSASLGDGPGLFEPVHGSAPTIAGKNIANPCGALLSAAMLLRSGLKLDAEAASLERAVETALASGLRTADLGGATSTAAFSDAVLEAITMKA